MLVTEWTARPMGRWNLGLCAAAMSLVIFCGSNAYAVFDTRESGVYATWDAQNGQKTEALKVEHFYEEAGAKVFLLQMGPNWHQISDCTQGDLEAMLLTVLAPDPIAASNIGAANLPYRNQVQGPDLSCLGTAYHLPVDRNNMYIDPTDQYTSLASGTVSGYYGFLGDDNGADLGRCVIDFRDTLFKVASLREQRLYISAAPPPGSRRVDIDCVPTVNQTGDYKLYRVPDPYFGILLGLTYTAPDQTVSYLLIKSFNGTPLGLLSFADAEAGVAELGSYFGLNVSLSTGLELADRNLTAAFRTRADRVVYDYCYQGLCTTRPHERVTSIEPVPTAGTPSVTRLGERFVDHEDTFFSGCDNLVSQKFGLTAPSAAVDGRAWVVSEFDSIIDASTGLRDVEQFVCPEQKLPVCELKIGQRADADIALPPPPAAPAFSQITLQNELQHTRFSGCGEMNIVLFDDAIMTKENMFPTSLGGFRRVVVKSSDANARTLTVQQQCDPINNPCGGWGVRSIFSVKSEDNPQHEMLRFENVGVTYQALPVPPPAGQDPDPNFFKLHVILFEIVGTPNARPRLVLEGASYGDVASNTFVSRVVQGRNMDIFAVDASMKTEAPRSLAWGAVALDGALASFTATDAAQRSTLSGLGRPLRVLGEQPSSVFLYNQNIDGGMDIDINSVVYALDSVWGAPTRGARLRAFATQTAQPLETQMKNVFFSGSASDKADVTAVTLNSSAPLVSFSAATVVQPPLVEFGVSVDFLSTQNPPTPILDADLPGVFLCSGPGTLRFPGRAVTVTCVQ